MSSTITQPNYTRYIRQGRTLNPVAVTAMPACTAQAYLALVEADWMRTDTLSPSMPRHNWAQSGLSNNFDASKYCGDYADGSQHGYATAICYTLRLPPDALTGAACDLEAVTATLYGDRWLADGAILAAIPSSSATPPTWAEALVATAATVPLMAVTPSNTGTDSTEEVTLEFTSLTAPAYLHLVLRLADYSTHRGAWIEGSALLDPTSLALTFSREVAADDPSGALVVPLRLYAATANRTPVLFTSETPVNLESLYFHYHWTAAMLRAGQGADGTPDSIHALTPEVSGSGLTMTAKGHIAKAWCPVAAVTGLSAWFRAVGAWPASPMRLSIFKGAEMPAVDDPATWAGSGDTCIGTARFQGVAVGDLLRVPLTANASSPLWLVAAYDDVDASDGPVGGSTAGVSLVDAHIAVNPVTDVSLPHFVHLGLASQLSLMLDERGDPMYLPYAYAYGSAHYVAGRSSSLPWLTPGGPATADIVSAAINEQGGADYDFAAVIDDEGAAAGIVRLACAGTLLAGATAYEGGNGYVMVSALRYGTLAALASSGAVTAGGQAQLATAINDAAITSAQAIVGHDSCLLWLSGYPGTPAAVGLVPPSFVVAVAALTNVTDMAIGSLKAVFRHADGSVTALNRADGSADTAVAAWTGIGAVATSGAAILGLASDGTLVVANGASYPGMDADVAAVNAAYVIGTVIGGANGSFVAAVTSAR
jgi:hypothetical protein